MGRKSVVIAQPEKDKRIGPHNGRELELMLAGQKPAAMFSAEEGMAPEDVGDADFAPHVESGRLKRFVHSTDDGRCEMRVYVLPTEEWRAKLLIHIDKYINDPVFRQTFTTDDLFRLDGALLGYDKDDIEFFVARSHERNR